jgi:hypothetical protein
MEGIAVVDGKRFAAVFFPIKLNIECVKKKS